MKGKYRVVPEKLTDGRLWLEFSAIFTPGAALLPTFPTPIQQPPQDNAAQGKQSRENVRIYGEHGQRNFVAEQKGERVFYRAKKMFFHCHCGEPEQ